MKFVIFLTFSIVAFSQATITVTVPGETNTSITIQSEGFSSIEAAMESQVISFPGPPVTLTGATTTGSTTFAVSSIPVGLSVINGIMMGGEVSQISAISGLNITVERARLATTAVASAQGTVVKFITAGKGGALIAYLLQQWLVTNLPTYPGPIIAAAQSTIATQNGTIQTTITGVISVAP